MAAFISSSTRAVLHFDSYLSTAKIKRKPTFNYLSVKLISASASKMSYDQVDSGILCEPCNGRGWLICDFCKGQKTNVKSETNRVYRRCPSCRAVGYILCSKCKVFKCVTFPDRNDGVELIL